MTTRRTRRPAAPKPAPEAVEVGATTTDAEKFHDWEKSQMDNAIDIARKVGAEAPELTHEEPPVVEVVEEKPLPKVVEFVAIPPAPETPAFETPTVKTLPRVSNPREIVRLTRNVRGANKRG